MYHDTINIHYDNFGYNACRGAGARLCRRRTLWLAEAYGRDEQGTAGMTLICRCIKCTQHGYRLRWDVF